MIPPSLQDGFFLDDEPGTMCRANFRLSLPGRAKADLSRTPQFEIRNSKLLWLFS